MAFTDSAAYQSAVSRAIEAADAYYNGTDELMTDAEYDALLETIAGYEGANPEDAIDHGLHTKVAAGTAAVGDVKHPTPMLSLDKAKTIAEVHGLLARAQEAAAAIGVPASDVSLIVEPKLDGMAMRAVYKDGRLVQVVTRGDGRAGEDVTARLARPQVAVRGLPSFIDGAPAEFELRGEMLMSHEDFEFSNANRVAAGKTAFANPRNATAGSVRAETLEYDVQMTFICYVPSGVSDANLLDAAHLDAVSQGADYEASIAEFGVRRADFDYPTDGVVIKVSNPDVRRRMGEGSRAPKWALAYKYEAQTGETIIRDILLDVGRTGNLSFTAVFDPVLVDGSTISRASVHNVDLIRKKDIRIGSKAIVQKNNDIIPQVVSVTNGPDTTPYVPPTEDADGFPYDTNQVVWRSTNPADSIGALIRYAASRDVLDIDGLGTSVADALVESELVNSLPDIFEVTEAQLASLITGFNSKSGSPIRFGEDRAAKLYAAIQEAKAQPLNRVITALGIRLTGRTFGRRLASHFKSLDALVAASRDDLLEVEGVGEGRADAIFDGLRKTEDTIKRLIALGVTSKADDSGSDKPLAGMSVVVTGAMTGPLAALSRTEVNELIDAKGGRASGSVSKNTSLLVCGEEGSSKWKKANDLGVRIVTPEEFAVMVGQA